MAVIPRVVWKSNQAGSGVRRLLPLSVLTVCATCIFAPSAHAQVTAYRLSDLSFGPVVAGTTRQIQPTEFSAGRFQITAPAGTQLSITFTLPTALTSGSADLAISFGTTDAAWSGVSDVAAATRFDPHQPIDVIVPASGSVYLWIGGRISPPPAQATGAHTGMVALAATQS